MTPTAEDAPRRPSTGVIFMAAAIVLAGTGVAVAVLLSRGDGSAAPVSHSPREVAEQPREGAPPAQTPTTAATVGGLAAGRYVQAGSFKIAADADAEQQRLAAEGINAEVLDSDLAQELYPGFQVLLVGPVENPATERTAIRELHDHGVPSAFARELTAAREVSANSVSGRWSGSVEEISSSRPKLNRSLSVTAFFTPSGREGQMEIRKLGCRISLHAVGAPSAASLSFGQDTSCLGAGTWRVRPAAAGLMVALLPPDNDLLFLGTLIRS